MKKVNDYPLSKSELEAMMKSLPERQLKILLVDDDEEVASEIEKTLHNFGIQVYKVYDGMCAKNLLLYEKFDLIITDICMPNLNGVELLHFVKRTARINYIPVILMTGFSSLRDKRMARKLHFDGFLAKPFEREELLEVTGSIKVA